MRSQSPPRAFRHRRHVSDVWLFKNTTGDDAMCESLFLYAMQAHRAKPLSGQLRCSDHHARPAGVRGPAGPTVPSGHPKASISCRTDNSSSTTYHSKSANQRIGQNASEQTRPKNLFVRIGNSDGSFSCPRSIVDQDLRQVSAFEPLRLLNAKSMPLPHALVAQLDRVLDYESRGRGFESSPARQSFPMSVKKFLLL